MSFAISAVAHRFHADMHVDLPVLQQPKFPPPPPPETHPVQVGKHMANAGLLSQVADYDWCGTKVPRFPFPLPPKGGDDGWCGTVPRPFPGPIPPTPQPWLDLANAAQSFR